MAACAAAVTPAALLETLRQRQMPAGRLRAVQRMTERGG